METARTYIVKGRVQGVGYRWFVEHTANAIGLRGWARNREDGSVEVYAVGNPGGHDELLTRLWKGPSAAHVVTVDQHEAQVEKLSGFSIRP